MIRRIGTQAMQCVHNKLIGVDHCEECAVRPRLVAAPIQTLGLSMQRMLEQQVIQLSHSTSVTPVWAGDPEGMTRGNLVFALGTGRPKEAYEGTELYLDVKVRIKHTTPLWRRILNKLLGRSPMSWKQNPGEHLRMVQGGRGLKKVTDQDTNEYVHHEGAACPKCGSDNAVDQSGLERMFETVVEAAAKGVTIKTCRDCHQTWYGAMDNSEGTDKS